MFATIVSAALVCAGSLVLGQAIMRLCGTRRWTWVSPSVGMSALMLVTVPALHLPGRAATTGVVAALLIAAAAVLVVRRAIPAPPLGSLVALIPLALLVWVPFASAGRAGTLGVSINNDMASHLGWADAYRSPAIAEVIGIQDGYPLGAHAVVAALAQCLGTSVDLAFAGLTAATPILLGMTALAALRPGASLPARALVATLGGLPFLVAGYYGQGSFKEVLQATFVLALVLELRRVGESGGRLRWLPSGLLVCGVLSVYSSPGLLWIVAIAGAWLTVTGVRALVAGRLRRVSSAMRREAAPLGLAAIVTLVVLAPQLPRLYRFFADNAGVNGTGIETSSLGNLAGPVPRWEALGLWDSPDYRFGPVDAFASGMWAAFALAVVLAGAVWMLRRGEWLLPLAAAIAYAIWELSDRTQAPYVAAKALMILAPLVMVVALVPLVEARRWAPRLPRAGAVGVWAVLAVFAVKALDDSWDALRVSTVGPRAHLGELRALQPVLGDGRTLFLGNDDFVRWELAPTPVTAPVIGIPQTPIRSEKAYAYGQPHDFDSVDAATLNSVEWVVTTRDPAGSTPPPQFELVEETPHFAAWRREGQVVERSLLSEAGGSPAAPLDCDTREGRRLSRRRGEAGVLRGSVAADAAPIPPGRASRVGVELTPGTWELALDYTSPEPLVVSASGMRSVMPANADRPGPRWYVGRITVGRAGPVPVTLEATKRWLTPSSAAARPIKLTATPVGGREVVPLRKACGRFVDWYRATGD